MELYSENENYKLYHGSMLDMLEVIDKESVDSIITDPPYELNFMGKGWDNSGIAFQPDTWKKCYEALKPGGYLLAFGGSRTFHRIAVAIEDAGFEIRDTIMWIYGSGFPKSMDISKSIDKKEGVQGEKIGERTFGKTSTGQSSGWHDNHIAQTGKQDVFAPATDLAKQWQGWGTALKPSFEPIIVARKPFKGSLVDNVIEYGVGGINIDECRVKTTDVWHRKKAETNTAIGYQRKNKSMYAQKSEGEMNENGRFPANTILTYDETDFDEVCGGFPTSSKPNGNITKKYKINNQVYGDYGYCNTWNAYQDSGSASRYFYCAKASKKDRDEGLEEFEEKQKYYCDGRSNSLEIFGSTDGGRKPLKNIHPTVKPTNLMQYLIRLVSPDGATILDCFNGSGSTGKAVMYENRERNKNYKYIGIELTEEYLPIAKARIEYVCNLEPEKDNQTNIFDFIGE